MSVFRAEGLTKNFGALRATDDVSLTIDRGEIHALIGPNGAGKSTLVNLISGVVRPDRGRIMIDGHDVTRLSTHRRAARGLARCFQITSVFRDQSVRQNLLLAVQAQDPMWAAPFTRASDRTSAERAEDLAARMQISSVLDRDVGALSHALQRKVDVAMALAGTPKILILDEPLAGMGADETPAMLTLIAALRQDMAILLIEHDMDAVFQLADRISVLNGGRILLSGSPATIRESDEVRDIYFGSGR